jgi:hypothetical protein
MLHPRSLLPFLNRFSPISEILPFKTTLLMGAGPVPIPIEVANEKTMVIILIVMMMEQIY